MAYTQFIYHICSIGFNKNKEPVGGEINGFNLPCYTDYTETKKKFSEILDNLTASTSLYVDFSEAFWINLRLEKCENMEEYLNCAGIIMQAWIKNPKLIKEIRI